jgi:hypothetical protein
MKQYKQRYECDYIEELKDAIVFLGLLTFSIDAIIGAFWICDKFFSWMLGF